MKAFLVVVGTLFAAIVVAHAMRFFAEPRLIRDPWYWVITVTAAGLSVWAWRLVFSKGRS
jgi:hypothetical protein